MLDIGWTELLVIGIVALIVVGPKDLPMMFRTLGRFTGQARKMAREFTRAMDEAADEAGVKEMQKDLRNIANPKKMGMDALKEATDELGNWSNDDLDDDNTKPISPKSTPKPSDGAGPETQKLAKERAETAAQRKEAASQRTAAPQTAEPEDPAA